MDSKPVALASLILVATACGLNPLLAGEPGMKTPAVTVTPEETDDLLANPGVGWQTFHRTREEDRNLPSWIPSTIHYARWGWGSLEPEPGKIDFAFLDKVLSGTREAGQKLAFRVMCCSTTPSRPYHPAWLKDLGGRIIETRRGKGPIVHVPDLDDPVILEKHLDFLRRLGERYDGHRDVDHVDLGSVGWWGEWHMSGAKNAKLPTLENRKKIVDAYLKAFKKTPLLMLIGGRECLSYATKRGTGWRADCLGDMGGFSKTWCHMRKGYPAMIREGGVKDAWKTAPVAWESCWDMRRWVKEKWPLRFIFNYALALHGSCLNNKSAPLPEGENIRPEIERFLRRLGYRLVLKELNHPARARAGDKLKLAMKWQNVGSAPCYRPYRLAYRLTSKDGYKKIAVSKITVSTWLPGSVELFTKEFFAGSWELPRGKVVDVADSIDLAADLPAGTYRLSLAVVGGESSDPAIRLGIKGRDEDGWYPLSEVQVSR